MGSALEICNQVDRKSNVLEAIEEHNDEKNYRIEEMTNADQHFRNEIEELKSHEEFQEFAKDKLLMGHVDRDEYYLGGWEHKFKKGKGLSYRKGEYIYYGEFDKTPNGTGFLKLYQQNIVVEGHFKNGVPEGPCKIKDLNGVYRFEGIINDQKHPTNGTFNVTNSEEPLKSYTITLDDYPNNKAKIVFHNGTEYLGDINFLTLLPSGEGEAHYTNQTRYAGQWENGEYHGEGTFTWSDGSNYKGSYLHGIKSGHGRYEYVSKKVYEGQWANGKQEGSGQLFSPMGEIVKEGKWRNGVFERAEVEL